MGRAGREFFCEEVDSPSILLLVKGAQKHLPVVSEFVHFILVAPGLVPSSDSGNFNCDEFFSGWMCKITIGWAVSLRCSIGRLRGLCLRRMHGGWLPPMCV